MDLLARKHHRGWRYKWCLLFPVLADVLFAELFCSVNHIYSSKKVRRPQLLYKVDLGVWHSSCVDRPETIPNFQAKVIPLNCWGRIDRQLWIPTGRSLPGTEMLICISKRLLLATHLLCPNLGKEMMELHTGCQNLSFATVVTPILMPSF